MKITEKISRKIPSWIRLLFWKVRLAKIVNRKTCYITCTGKNDGAGAQVQAVMSTILCANELGLTYVHTPFKEIAHNRDRKKAASQWEDFLGLGKGEVSLEDLQLNELNVVRIDSPKAIKKSRNTLFVIKHCHDFADEFPDCYASLSKAILDKYWLASGKACLPNHETDTVNIAIHIRRGDVDNTKSGRYTSNQFYVYLLTHIFDVLDSMGVNFSAHLYSQGSREDFRDLDLFELSYHLDECPFRTFSDLTSSDILVMSKSSFSYSAALLSQSIKIYQPFWHKPLKDWVVADPQKTDSREIFDELKFEQKLYKKNSITQSKYL